jgi:thioredoxin 1
MVVHQVKSLEEYKNKIKEAGEHLVVVDFFAIWCGPCKRISPFLEQLSERMTNVVFLKVDVDEAEDIAREEGITAMPTFYLFKNGKKVADLVGAAQEKLEKLIHQHA